MPAQSTHPRPRTRVVLVLAISAQRASGALWGERDHHGAQTHARNILCGSCPLVWPWTPSDASEPQDDPARTI
eukprot:344303-Chlamydomonas_euryale.AAC.5